MAAKFRSEIINSRPNDKVAIAFVKILKYILANSTLTQYPLYYEEDQIVRTIKDISKEPIPFTEKQLMNKFTSAADWYRAAVELRQMIVDAAEVINRPEHLQFAKAVCYVASTIGDITRYNSQTETRVMAGVHGQKIKHVHPERAIAIGDKFPLLSSVYTDWSHTHDTNGITKWPYILAFDQLAVYTNEIARLRATTKRNRCNWLFSQESIGNVNAELTEHINAEVARRFDIKVAERINAEVARRFEIEIERRIRQAEALQVETLLIDELETLVIDELAHFDDPI